MLNTSMGIITGSIIPAACIGEITSDKSGTASNAIPPKPPLDIPVTKTAIIATHKKRGSESNSNIFTFLIHLL